MNLLLVIFALLTLSTLSAHAQLPAVPRPNNIAVSSESVELGRLVFFDRRFSDDGTVSCATCHDPSKGWSDGQPTAVGVRGQRGTRNSPTIVNAAYQRFMFHDARTFGTTTQSLLPIVNPIEMGVQSERQVMTKFAAAYSRNIVSVFGIPQGGIDPNTQSGQRNLANIWAKSIADFETTVISSDAPVDRAIAGDLSDLSDKAQAGFRHFVSANCMACHPAPLFSDGRLHNNGVAIAQGRLQSGLLVPFDSGAAVNGRARLFKTPTLREIHRTAPYTHSGRWADLKRIVQHYNAGGSAKFNGRQLRDPQIDPRIKPLGLTGEQEDELVEFLRDGFAGRDYPDIPSPFQQ
jgi:cytochrome c peroxidase